ncbi:MAG: cytochrome c oxidase accessory protein CcoG [Chitinophagaceae bacterium]|nr:cytochrome c oxidase accessory protein CcoG [Chitinophagaceae bacterium]MBP6478428.1 cytochrome c oxidase accessory protein CcoG [Chitinophagaceae bacterium]MBP7109548.1 cytochrome c oxidase accessory protein CcoG [Chitinophagaceae bacterium]MBP7315726.1 cytochrome c oxidase accessory protein CcoG [Chitinophagaceae bacterium]HQV55742.1 cytochrome c oxidase accessory protein CcoG [Chitinophagaceae bacterium]
MIETKPNDEQTESFRDRLATVDEKGKRKWVFAQKPKGKFYNIRTLVSLGFFALFIAIPFIKLNGRPLFLFNIPESKFIIFGKIFWPQDFFIFGLTMVTFIIFIVLFTAAFGRLFCGWVCPQTIFMEMLFRKVEYLIEGDAAKQKLLKKSPWTAEKIRKKATKHTVFFILAFIIANFFLAYIIGIDELKKIISEPVSEHMVGFLSLLLFAGIFYGVYASFREQVCTVVCPYGRLQSVLLDRNSMIVAYDYKRGEPREKFKKNVAAEINTGDCIDCFQCVKVCPTGIDIRNGTQMECVGCTACIDACDKMMTAVQRPKGLIRYASENGISEGKKLRFTGRMKFYTLLLIILSGILTLLLLSRKDIDGTILRTKGLTYQERGTDSLSNLFNIKVINKTIKDMPVTLRLEGDALNEGKIELVGASAIHLKQEDQATGSFFVVLPRKFVTKRKIKIGIGLYSGDKKITELNTNFTGPFTRNN